MINGICKEIEQSVGRKLQTPKDFDFLRECIYARLKVLVSSTTLKRVWGYLKDGVQTRVGTLDILARFLGFADYDAYLHALNEGMELQSSPVLSRKLSVPDELKKGDKLCLTWQPNRRCELLYQGNLSFKVIDSVHTRLCAGDTFKCSLFVEGEPLYLDNLCQKGGISPAYVCGKKSGIRFERIF